MAQPEKRGVIRARAEEIPSREKREHEGYEYAKKTFVPRGTARQLVVNMYQVPPGKAAYPYHYHTRNEEVFYIISGSGLLRTPEGEARVSAGDVLFFPADETGAHKLTNVSESENLVYLDIDTANELDVSFYPDSGKLGVWGLGINRVFRGKDAVSYYEGE